MYVGMYVPRMWRLESMGVTRSCGFWGIVDGHGRRDVRDVNSKERLTRLDSTRLDSTRLDLISKVGGSLQAGVGGQTPCMHIADMARERPADLTPGHQAGQAAFAAWLRGQVATRSRTGLTGQDWTLQASLHAAGLVWWLHVMWLHNLVRPQALSLTSLVGSSHPSAQC